MLEVKNLSGGYKNKAVLHDVSFSAPGGCITAILGPNGCGKSTLLKMICGILPASSGRVLLYGRDLRKFPAGQIAQKVAYLAQQRQTPDITVGRLVLHGRFPYLSYPRRYRQEDYRIAQEVMERLNIRDLAEMQLNRLSGGQQQKAYIAMALAQDTDVVLLDEPTTYLDVSHQLQLLHQAKELADSGKHVLMVIHDLSHGLETADRVVLINKGTVVMEGSPEKAYRSAAAEQVFSVKISRVLLNGKWRYLCTEK